MGKNLSFVLNNLEDLVAAFFISITTILVVINIVLRYVFNSGLVWSEEVATGCFVWSVFIGAVAVFKHRGHVGVDIIVKRMPQGMQKAIGLITDVILVALNGYMSYLSIIYIPKSSAMIYLFFILSRPFLDIFKYNTKHKEPPLS